MGDLATLATLAGGGALGTFSAAVWILLRLLRSTRTLLDGADERYRNERKDHEETQRKLDAALDQKRDVQQKLDELSREVAQLRHVTEQQNVLIAQQTARIAHLEAEVARQRGAGV